MYKIIGANGQIYGPVNTEQIRRWIGENRVQAHMLVQVEGAAEWKPLASIPELATELKSAQPPIAPPPAYNARAASKIPAGLCGILLGYLGIHKFILGYTSAGLIMLLVSILTCGFGAWVMWIIGLVEGIIYLCKPDEEFVRLYVDGKKEWF